jgi:hypothetical protein
MVCGSSAINHEFKLGKWSKKRIKNRNMDNKRFFPEINFLKASL